MLLELEQSFFLLSAGKGSPAEGTHVIPVRKKSSGAMGPGNLVTRIDDGV